MFSVMSVCVSVYLSVCVSVHPSVRLSVRFYVSHTVAQAGALHSTEMRSCYKSCSKKLLITVQIKC